MKINYVICTYGGIYARKFGHHPKQKEQYLKYNLILLNEIATNIDTITIMRPKVDPDHIEIKDYYNFDGLHIDNILNKIRVIDCNNLGLSYGQFIFLLDKDLTDKNLYDYYIFTEDDYVPSLDFFEEELINNYDRNIPNYLCAGINKELDNSKMMFQHEGSRFMVPDFSLGIISKENIEKFFNVWSWSSIKDIYEKAKQKPFNFIQILFGYFFYRAGIEIMEANQYLSVFYDCDHDLYLINFQRYDRRADRKRTNSEVYNSPIFLPLDIFPPSDIDYTSRINLISAYLNNQKEFMRIYRRLRMRLTSLI